MGYENEGEEPITNDFDFEKSNQLFDKDDDIVDTAAPAYKKENFFDTLQESSKEKSLQCVFLKCRGMEGMNYSRGKDAEKWTLVRAHVDCLPLGSSVVSVASISYSTCATYD